MLSEVMLRVTRGPASPAHRGTVVPWPMVQRTLGVRSTYAVLRATPSTNDRRKELQEERSAGHLLGKSLTRLGLAKEMLGMLFTT